MKESKKSIEANLRNKIAKQYTSHIESLQTRLNETTEKYINKNIELHKAQDRIAELEEELEQYRDWNTRLQEFMDMSEEDRKREIENMKSKEKFNNYIENSALFKMMNLFNMYL